MASFFQTQWATPTKPTFRFGNPTVCDFEQGFINAIKEFWPDAKVIGCLQSGLSKYTFTRAQQGVASDAMTVQPTVLFHKANVISMSSSRHLKKTGILIYWPSFPMPSCLMVISDSPATLPLPSFPLVENKADAGIVYPNALDWLCKLFLT
jgi:hypothetical protein